MTITLDLPFPPSMNSLWRKGRTGMYRSPRYMEWINAAGWELKRQKPGKIIGDYAIVVSLERKDNRRRDCDNFIKAISDLLVLHGVIEDDSMAQSVTAMWVSDVTGCRVHLASVASDSRSSVKRRAA